MEAARKQCYDAVYRNGTDKEALQKLLEFSLLYGEITPVDVLLHKLSKLGVETAESRFFYDTYCQVCKDVNKLMDSDEKAVLELCINTATAGLLLSRRSLYLRLVIVKCLIRLNRLLEAKKICYEILQDAPKYVPTIVQEGIISFVQGFFEGSLLIFDRVNKLDPKGPNSHFIKDYQEKARNYSKLSKKATFEESVLKHDEAIITISSIIVLGLNDKAFCNNKEFLVPLYISRARLYEATNQLDKMFDDCVKSENIKRTTEAEEMMSRCFTKKRELYCGSLPDNTAKEPSPSRCES